MTEPQDPGPPGGWPRRPAPADVAQQRRIDESMTLLREVMERPLDPGYAAAAERRHHGTQRPLAWWGKVIVVVVTAVLGLGAVWATRELRAPQAGADARSLLGTQIEKRSEFAAQQRGHNDELIAQIESLQVGALAGPDDATLDRLDRLGAAAGGRAVEGPGLVITLDDSRDAQEGVEDSRSGLVQDLDLQVLVNGLWAAGAEAVAINGHRLTTLTAIRSAGDAVFVDLVPVQRPYEVAAVGDAAQLQAQLARSSAGAHLATLAESFGISVEQRPQDHLRLGSSSARTLRYAEVLDGPAPSAPEDPRVDEQRTSGPSGSDEEDG